MLANMSLATIVASAVVVLLVLSVSWVLWRLIVERSDSSRDEPSAVGHDAGRRRFDTTMGDLRDLRETLSPSNSGRHHEGRKSPPRSS